MTRDASILWKNIAENLKLTVHWLRDTGLTKAEVASVIARFPTVLGCSIDESLKPTTERLREVGLTKAEVVRVIVRKPEMLGCSIEDNLKPTVQWLGDMGLTEAEVAMVSARFAPFLGLSLEKNLKPKVRWLLERFSSKHVRHLLTRNPYMFGQSLKRWAQRFEVLEECGKLSVFGSAVRSTDAAVAVRYEGQQNQLVQE